MLAFQMYIIGNNPNHLKQCRMMRIIELINLAVLSVHSQSKLGQVIGSNTEEINLSG